MGGHEQPAFDAVLAAVTRVLGAGCGGVRRDTPLALIGWDSLARLCWEDAMHEAGWVCRDAQTAITVGDLVDACAPASTGPHHG